MHSRPIDATRVRRGQAQAPSRAASRREVQLRAWGQELGLWPAIATAFAALGIALAASGDLRADPGDAYRGIDIDRYVAEERPLKAGTSAILQPRAVRFDARLKQGPRPHDVEYLYTALSFFPLDPEPKVSHRMFVTTPGGHILPVYVEDSQVPLIDAALVEGDGASFYGWHVFNYSKGPAILVIGFVPETRPQGSGDTP